LIHFDTWVLFFFGLHWAREHFMRACTVAVHLAAPFDVCLYVRGTGDMGYNRSQPGQGIDITIVYELGHQKKEESYGDLGMTLPFHYS
jgi:hypothetical protein